MVASVDMYGMTDILEVLSSPYVQTQVWAKDGLTLLVDVDDHPGSIEAFIDTMERDGWEMMDCHFGTRI